MYFALLQKLSYFEQFEASQQPKMYFYVQPSWYLWLNLA